MRSVRRRDEWDRPAVGAPRVGRGRMSKQQRTSGASPPRAPLGEKRGCFSRASLWCHPRNDRSTSLEGHEERVSSPPSLSGFRVPSRPRVLSRAASPTDATPPRDGAFLTAPVRRRNPQRRHHPPTGGASSSVVSSASILPLLPLLPLPRSGTPPRARTHPAPRPDDALASGRRPGVERPRRCGRGRRRHGDSASQGPARAWTPASASAARGRARRGGGCRRPGRRYVPRRCAVGDAMDASPARRSRDLARSRAHRDRSVPRQRRSDTSLAVPTRRRSYCARPGTRPMRAPTTRREVLLAVISAFPFPLTLNQKSFGGHAAQSFRWWTAASRRRRARVVRFCCPGRRAAARWWWRPDNSSTGTASCRRWRLAPLRVGLPGLAAAAAAFSCAAASTALHSAAAHSPRPTPLYDLDTLAWNGVSLADCAAGLLAAPPQSTATPEGTRVRLRRRAPPGRSGRCGGRRFGAPLPVDADADAAALGAYDAAAALPRGGLFAKDARTARASTPLAALNFGARTRGARGSELEESSGRVELCSKISVVLSPGRRSAARDVVDLGNAAPDRWRAIAAARRRLAPADGGALPPASACGRRARQVRGGSMIAGACTCAAGFADWQSKAIGGAALGEQTACARLRA